MRDCLNVHTDEAIPIVFDFLSDVVLPFFRRANVSVLQCMC